MNHQSCGDVLFNFGAKDTRLVHHQLRSSTPNGSTLFVLSRSGHERSESAGSGRSSPLFSHFCAHPSDLYGYVVRMIGRTGRAEILMERRLTTRRQGFSRSASPRTGRTQRRISSTFERLVYGSSFRPTTESRISRETSFCGVMRSSMECSKWITRPRRFG